MCQYSSVDGCAQDWHLMHLGNLAIGGNGEICQVRKAKQVIAVDTIKAGPDRPVRGGPLMELLHVQWSLRSG